MKTKAEEFNKLASQLGHDTGESLVDAMKKNDRIEKHAGYCQVVEMTREEKIAMYMRLTKKELIEMLLENQDLLMQSIMRNNNITDKSSWPPPYNETTNTRTKFTSSASVETKTLYNLNSGGLRKK